MLESRFDPLSIEKKILEFWNKENIFSNFHKRGEETFSIMMPPPNITGSLHMGHALTFTLQDILVRYQFKMGKRSLWQPGTDHAGIATEIVVEKRIEKKQMTKSSLGRDEFLKEIWKWKDISGNAIIDQLKVLGTCADWKKSRFTLDPKLCKAVNKVFVDLYKQGLIYKDKRLVNWDTELQTAISDLEVIQKEQKGFLWFIKYKIESSNNHIVVATTRPETMFGDTAIAIHPKNSSLKKLIGKNAIIPLTEKVIPIIADEYADPKKGSGAVKITPAHDFNDFEVGKKHNLPIINIFNKKGVIDSDLAGNFNGLDRFVARSRIVKKLENIKQLEKIAKNKMVIPVGDRSGSIIEPFLTEQWFCNAKQLSKPLKTLVKNNKIKFFPKTWQNTFNHWINNIQPWCISRQIWWGHRIPVWYTKNGKIIVAENYEEAVKTFKKKFKSDEVNLRQDPDVLDTWFSSALWPFSTLGWPKITNDIKLFYPSNVLVTGFDIIFFWVARMLMMSLHFTKKVPFRDIYIHPLVRDQQGQKMSKSKGNVIDPRILIEKYGADALRFTLAGSSSQGRDIRLSDKLVEDNRKFITKLWNISRFYKLNNFSLRKTKKMQVEMLINKWIFYKLSETQQKITKNIENYNFNLCIEAIYKFVWNDFCDLYIEFLKPYLKDKSKRKEINYTISETLFNILNLLNPFLPFVTEEISKNLNFSSIYDLALRKFTIIPLKDCKFSQYSDFEKLKNLITVMRDIKVKKRLKDTDLLILNKTIIPKWLSENEIIIKSMFEINNIIRKNKSFNNKKVNHAAFVVSGIRFGIIFDVNEKNITQNIEKIKFYKKEIMYFEKKLSNKLFLKNAPKKIVEDQKKKLLVAKNNLSLLEN